MDELECEDFMDFAPIEESCGLTEKQKQKKEYNEEYNSRPAVKERTKEYRKEYYSRPAVKERTKEYRKEYYSRPEVKEQKKEYNSRPEVKERRKEQRKEYYQKMKSKKLKEAKMTDFEKVYNLLMDYWEYIPEEDRKKIDKELAKIDTNRKVRKGGL